MSAVARVFLCFTVLLDVKTKESVNVSKPQRFGVQPSEIRIIQNLWPSLTVQLFFQALKVQRPSEEASMLHLSKNFSGGGSTRVVVQGLTWPFINFLCVDAVLSKSLLCHESQGLAVTETRCGWFSCQSCSRGRRGLLDIRPCRFIMFYLLTPSTGEALLARSFGSALTKGDTGSRRCWGQRNHWLTVVFCECLLNGNLKGNHPLKGIQDQMDGHILAKVMIPAWTWQIRSSYWYIGISHEILAVRCLKKKQESPRT